MALRLVGFSVISDLLKLTQAESAYPQLTVLLDNVQYSFEAYLKANLENGSFTETKYLSSNPTTLVSVDTLPLLTLISVVVNGVTDSSAKITNGGIRLSSSAKEVDVVISYTGGYTSGTLPPAIVRAASLQVVHEFNRLPHIGATSVTTEGGTVETPELGLLKEVRRLLNPYRHPMRLGV